MKVLEADCPGPLPDGFVELPALVYAGDPAWTPEEPLAVQGAFSAMNPWFATGVARAFGVPGRARAAAFLQPGFHIEGEPAAFLGYFETIGDSAAEGAVIEKLTTWAVSKGARVLYGPINFSPAYLYRLRLEAPPGAGAFFGEPYNPPSYPERLAALGFSLHLRYFTQQTTAALARRARDAHRGELEQALAAGYRFESLPRAEWTARSRELLAVVNTAFGDNFGYSPLPAVVLASHVRGIVERLCPIASVVTTGPAGDVAGAYIVTPDYSALTRQGAGRARVAASQVKYDEHLAQARALGQVGCIFKTVAVAAQHRRQGLSEGVMVAALDRAGDLYDGWSVALVREGNFSRRFFAEVETGARTYGLYAKRLSPTG